jgi:hypothetical protein
MKSAGRATIFELRDMIGSPNVSVSVDKGKTGDARDVRWARGVPEPFHDGLLARLRSAWEVACGRAYPCAWPEAGDLELALQPPPRPTVRPVPYPLKGWAGL